LIYGLTLDFGASLGKAVRVGIFVLLAQPSDSPICLIFDIGILCGSIQHHAKGNVQAAIVFEKAEMIISSDYPVKDNNVGFYIKLPSPLKKATNKISNKIENDEENGQDPCPIVRNIDDVTMPLCSGVDINIRSCMEKKEKEKEKEAGRRGMKGYLYPPPKAKREISFTTLLYDDTEVMVFADETGVLGGKVRYP
jgi:hypothetical protein